MFYLLLAIYLLPVVIVLCILLRIIRWSLRMILRLSYILIRRLFKYAVSMIVGLWHIVMN